VQIIHVCTPATQMRTARRMPPLADPLPNGTSVCLVDGQHKGAVAAHRDVTAADVEGECGIVLLFGL
jgi:hypothetical protein